MVSAVEQRVTAEAWAVLASDASGTEPPPPVAFVVTGGSGHLRSRFAVEPTAVACVGVALLAAAALHRQRGGSTDRVGVDRGHVAAAVRSERHFLDAGPPAGPAFHPLSRFWRGADGWVRTHANYAWHRAALVQALGTSDNVADVTTALARLPVEQIEEQVFAAGGIAAAVRTVEAWRASPQGRALASEPLIGHEATGTAAARARPAGELPASGVRVVDLTRVIAGPVCTRFLAALGADVLRIDPPHRPDMPPGSVGDSLLGKRSALLDLRLPDAASTLHRLLDVSDVVVCGYRPGALGRFGLSAEALASDHPGLVIAYLDAWGHSGPWSGRRGFDSVVQAPTGIADGESGGEGDEPGSLPCQLLDHGTGYLAAAAVLDGLRRQGTVGATHVRRLSLARTALWLTATTDPEPPTSGPETGSDPSAWLDSVDATEGKVTAVAPPGRVGDDQLRWRTPLTGYGSDVPSWDVPPPE